VSSTPKVACRNVWKIFGPQPRSVINSGVARASKAEILAKTGHVMAVREISFEVRQGETFVVMGLSGSGKSTLLRCLPRLIDPSFGQVLIDGEDVATMDEQKLREVRRHKMSMVFQHFGLFPHRRILDNVAYGLEIQGMPKAARYARAQEVIELVNLKGWENHYPGQLSGGMQQRVGLARALAVNPEILLFDEPFSALDPLIRREMQDELITLQEQMHKTLIFITHDFAEALKLGDRIAIMKDGEFVQVGTPQEVVLYPADDYVREFTKDVPRAKVLTAQNIMTPAPVGASPQQAVPAHTLLDDLLPLVAMTEQPIPVVNTANRIIGSIDRTAVLMAMSGLSLPPQPPSVQSASGQTPLLPPPNNQLTVQQTPAKKGGKR